MKVTACESNQEYAEIMTIDKEQIVREIAIQRPEVVGVFESVGIDYCCGGGQTLKQACQRENLDPEEVLRLLTAAPAQGSDANVDWLAQPLDTLTKHIVGHHHAYIRRMVPELDARLNRVVEKHGPTHPETVEIQQLFAALSHELLTHMNKEEQVLFPYLDRLELAARGASGPPRAFFGSVNVPISRMLADHADAGESLARIRQLSANYEPPQDACTTFRALYSGLREFAIDLHQHVHLENNILFPRALDLERKTRRQEQAHASL
jgi:regulator of cell morphogenesis and NO signaling